MDPFVEPFSAASIHRLVEAPGSVRGTPATAGHVGRPEQGHCARRVQELRLEPPQTGHYGAPGFLAVWGPAKERREPCLIGNRFVLAAPLGGRVPRGRQLPSPSLAVVSGHPVTAAAAPTSPAFVQQATAHGSAKGSIAVTTGADVATGDRLVVEVRSGRRAVPRRRQSPSRPVIRSSR